jgi:hypothetical protein
MLLVAPRVNVPSSHVVGRDVRVPNKISVCHDNHCLAGLGVGRLDNGVATVAAKCYVDYLFSKNFLKTPGLDTRQPGARFEL